MRVSVSVSAVVWILKDAAADTGAGKDDRECQCEDKKVTERRTDTSLSVCLSAISLSFFLCQSYQRQSHINNVAD